MRKLTEEYIKILEEKELEYELEEGNDTDEDSSDTVMLEFVGKYENEYRLFVDIDDMFCNSTAIFFSDISKETMTKLLPEINKMNDDYRLKFYLMECSDGTYSACINFMVIINEGMTGGYVFSCSAFAHDMVEDAYKKIISFID